VNLIYKYEFKHVFLSHFNIRFWKQRKNNLKRRSQI